MLGLPGTRRRITWFWCVGFEVVGKFSVSKGRCTVFVDKLMHKLGSFHQRFVLLQASVCRVVVIHRTLRGLCFSFGLSESQ